MLSRWLPKSKGLGQPKPTFGSGACAAGRVRLPKRCDPQAGGHAVGTGGSAVRSLPGIHTPPTRPRGRQWSPSLGDAITARVLVATLPVDDPNQQGQGRSPSAVGAPSPPSRSLTLDRTLTRVA